MIMTVKKEINLMTPEDKKHGNIVKISRRLIFSAFILFLLGAVTVAFLWVELQKVYAKKAQIESEINSLKYVNEIHDLYNNKARQLDEKQKALNEMVRDKRGILDILNVIKNCLPENTYITDFSSNRGETFNFTVISPEPLDTIKLIVKFREPGLFEDIDMNTISLKNDALVNINLKLKGAK